MIDLQENTDIYIPVDTGRKLNLHNLSTEI